MSSVKSIEEEFQEFRVHLLFKLNSIRRLTRVDNLEENESLVHREVVEFQEKILEEQRKILTDIEGLKEKLNNDETSDLKQRKFYDHINELEKNYKTLEKFKNILEMEKIVARSVFEQIRKEQEKKKDLKTARIKIFQKFIASESTVSEKCNICLDDFKVGMLLMRINCKGKHVFCEKCCEIWFADKNTCPLCREAVL